MSVRNFYTALGAKNTPCRILFLMTLALYMIAIPFSKFLMSLAGVILVANWFLECFLERNLWKKFAYAAKSKVIWVVLLIYIVHLLGFIYTKNIAFAFADIWIKVPMFFIPIIFYTSKPLSRNEIQLFLYVYVLGVLFSSLFGFFRCLPQEFNDMRKMAVYISYVRFELNICFAIFVSFYLLLQENKWKYFKIFPFIASIWFLFLLVYAGLMTGIILLIIISFVLIIRASIRQKNLFLRFLTPALFLAALGGITLFIYTTAKNYFSVPPFDSTKIEYTADGNAYTSDFDMRYVENGNYVFAYLCEAEIAEAWNKRSPMDYGDVCMTLIRYLNSKGLRKDRLAVKSLADEEITTIENGIGNIAYTHDFAVVRRIHELFWEINDYRQTRTVVGYSFAQRVELWKISLSAIQKHPWLGVGTGDVKEAFAKELVEKDSPLAFTNKRSHNQYFTFLIAFGVIGLGLILFSIFYPAIILGKFKEPLFLVFFILAMLSMFTEDTLEPQDGATFFTFFYSFFLFFGDKKFEGMGSSD
jgi:hypothetical protein